MEKTIKPFEQLSEDDQKAAIDVCVSAVLLGLRIPTTGKPLYDWIATEFANCRTLPPNVVKYALRSLGKELYVQDWTMTIEKRGNGVATEFSTRVSGGPNGQRSE
jgi:hypothetical protein